MSISISTQKLAQLVVISLVSVVSSTVGQAALDGRSFSSTNLAGCYELELGRWWPCGLGEETQFVTPPARIQLLAEEGTEGWEEGHMLLRALPNTSGRKGPSFWDVRTTNRIELAWTDGFTGVTLDLRRQKDGYGGWAHPHFDSFHLIKHLAHVKMQKIVCPSP